VIKNRSKPVRSSVEKPGTKTGTLFSWCCGNPV
jgi:hypothetical protein